MKMFVPLQKVDAETRMVYGYASTYNTDDIGETIEKAALGAALPLYMQFANIREMHQLKAVGVTKEAELDDKGLYIAAKIVDESAWQKCMEGVYKGFSIGGRVTARDPENKKLIKGVMMTEISLADRPVNPECVFDMVKAHASPEQIAASKKAVEVATTLFKDRLAINAEPDVMQDSIFKTALHVLPMCCPDGVTVPEGVLLKAVQGEFNDVAAPAASAGAPAAAAAAADGSSKTEGAAAADDKVVKAAEGKPIGGDMTKVNEPLRKGLYTVRQFADLLQSLQWILQDMEYESSAEGDASPIPPAMKAWLEQGVTLFIASATEEARELVGVREPDDAGAAAAAVVLELCAKPGELRKNFDSVLAKAGARHSKADKARLQGIHDHAVSMGADCGGNLSKVAGAEDLQKAVGTLTAERDDLLKKNTELEAQVKTLSDMPQAPKGVVRAVTKEGEDALGKAVDAAAGGEEPDADESVHDAIKKAHQKPTLMKLG